jgi:2,5-dioxopentanoate dehydrogenase
MNLLGTSFVGYSRSLGTRVCGHGLRPESGKPLDPAYFAATDEEVARALQLAADAFPAYSALPGKARSAFLRDIAAEIEGAVEDIVARGTLETALPEPRMRGETARTTGQLRLFAELIEEGSWVDARIERANPDRQPLPKPDIRSMLCPLGPVAVFCASNFPLAFSVAGGDTASALAAGCPVVVVAHSSHPGVAEIVASAVIRAAQANQLPEGVFSLLYGGGRSVGQAVVRHPATQAVGFTGSRAGGTALMEIATTGREQPIPVYAEMSSVNPLVVLPGSLTDGADALAAGYLGSLTLGVGQFCTNPGLVFLADECGEAGDALLAKLRELVETAAPGTMLNPGICDAYADATAVIASTPGVETLARSANETGPGQGAPAVFVVSIADFFANPNLQGEMFGPAALIVRGSLDEIEAAIVGLEGQLTASIHASESELAARPTLVRSLRQRAGRLVFNGFPTGVEVCSSMVHGGPFPATSDGRSTSVGTMAILRFTRPIAWQGFPDSTLPPELQDSNPLGIHRSEN